MTVDRNTLPARQRILLTAHDLFYQEGIRATGIDRIIKESGVTKVTFYRHFPSKNDLITAFLAYRHQQWLTWFSTAWRNGSTIRVFAAARLSIRPWRSPICCRKACTSPAGISNR